MSNYKGYYRKQVNDVEKKIKEAASGVYADQELKGNLLSWTEEDQTRYFVDLMNYIPAVEIEIMRKINSRDGMVEYLESRGIEFRFPPPPT